ncbi:MAG: hypothetical protein Q8M29_02420 [Bacteroidota bacterium]|nr:hypothetical protein [Bacteroidota bacterium]
MAFCNTIDSIIGTNRKRKLSEGFSFSLYSKASSIPEEAWKEANEEGDFFLEKKYLQATEILHEDNVSFRYVLVYKHQKPILIAYFQINDFTADVFGDMVQMQLNDIQSKRAKLFEHYLDHKKDSVVMRLVTCGNNFISGEHAFAYNKLISKKEACELMSLITDSIGKSVKLRGKISAMLVKDFYKDCLPQSPMFNDKFMEFSVEPNMVITIPENVNSLADYIALFSKKYRNRVKSIFKHKDGIEVRELSFEDIKKHNASIYNLYEKVFMNAKFKLVKLSYDYFTEMKRLFPEEFKVYGFFKDGELVAFNSSILLKEMLEAHFIGFNYGLNKEFELYQNLLYHFIELAILNKKKTVGMGRTASEIKSTTGAKANELVCYIKPQNTVSKVILKPFISFLQPTEWIPRNPFKEE